MSAISPKETYTLAHTAQCKLQLAANRPDRNLRFILGHACTLDSLLLRIVEIEEKGLKDDVQQARKDNDPSNPRRVSFVDNSNRPTGPLRNEEPSERGRKPSPPPDAVQYAIDGSSSDEDDDDYVGEEEFDDDEALGLTRFASGSARPPRDLDSDSEDEDDEPKSPPPIPSDDVLREVTGEEGDEVLSDLYETVRGCGCQSHDEEGAPEISKIWEIPPEKQAGGKPRTAVIQVRV